MNVDSGINKKLSEKPPPDYEPPVIKQKNILGKYQQEYELLVEGERMELKDLKEAAIKFIDNGGGVGKPGEDGTLGQPCDYCKENEGIFFRSS